MSANKDSLSIPAGTISTPVDEERMAGDVHTSVPENVNLTSNPLLYVLKKPNSPDYSSSKDFKNTEKPTAIDQDTPSQAKQVKCLAPVLSGKHTKDQNLDTLGGTILDCCKPSFSFSSLCCQRANEPPTDDQIREFIKKRLASYKNISTTAGQRHKDKSSEKIEANVALTPKSTVASEKQTEYPQIMRNVTATCTKNEDESPVVLTAMAPMTLDELTEKRLFNRGLSYEESNESFQATNLFTNMCKNLDEDTKPVKAMGLKNEQGVTDVSGAFQFKESLSVHKNATSEPQNQEANTKEMLDPQLCHIQIVNVVSLNTNQQLCQRSCEDSRKDAGLVHLQNEVPEQPSESENQHQQAFSACNIKDPQYEDISDDEDTLQQKKKIVDTDQPSSLHNVAEQVSHTKSDYESVSECQTNCSSEWLPLSFENEDQMDVDDWIVLPISISDLKFEADGEAEDDPAVIVLKDGDTESIKNPGDTRPKEQMLHQPASEPVSDHSQIEEFDTLESFLKAKCAQFRRLSKSTPTMELDPTTEPHEAQRRWESDSDDNCETDDSCNYSPPHEHNYLTVPSVLLKSSAPVTSGKEDTVPKKGNEPEATQVQVSQTRQPRQQKLSEIIGTSAVQPNSNIQNVSKKEDIIILDSDTESESDCEMAAKRRVTSSSQEGSLDQPKVQLRKTVHKVAGTHEKLQENIIIVSDTEDESDKNSQDTNEKVLFCTGSKDCGEIRYAEQLTEAKCDSEPIHKANTQTTSQREVVHKTEKVGTRDINDKKKASIQRALSSELDDSESASLNTQNRQSTIKKLLSARVPQSVDKGADPTLRLNPVIPRLFVQKSSQSSKYLKLVKESKSTFDGNKTLPLKTLGATHKKTDSLPKTDQDRCVPNSKSCEKSQMNLVGVSRRPSLPSQERPSTSKNGFYTDGQLSEVRRRSASSKDSPTESSAFYSHPVSKQISTVPAHLHSSKRKRSLSCSNNSALNHNHPLTQGGPPSSAATHLPAKKRAVEDWSNSYFPLRRDRRHNLGKARPTSSASDRTPRKRHNSHRSTNPLMKKAKFEAVQLTKEINRDTSRERRSSVGKGLRKLKRPNRRL